MPKIIKTDAQEIALKTISEQLKVVNSLNQILKNEVIDACNLKITGQNKGKKVSDSVQIPYDIVSLMFKDYRKKVIKECLDKSKTYSILLDDDELAILGIVNTKEETNTPNHDENNANEEIQTLVGTDTNPVKNDEMIYGQF